MCCCTPTLAPTAFLQYLCTLIVLPQPILPYRSDTKPPDPHVFCFPRYPLISQHYLSVCLPLLLLATCCHPGCVRCGGTLDHRPSSMHTLPQTHNQIPILHFFTPLQTGTFAKLFQFGTLVRSKWTRGATSQLSSQVEPEKNVETAGERFFSLVSDNSGDLADIKEEPVFRRGIGGENLDIMKRDDKSGPQVTGLCLRALPGEGVVSVHQQS